MIPQPDRVEYIPQPAVEKRIPQPAVEIVKQQLERVSYR